jgi:hypothetical protein
VAFWRQIAGALLVAVAGYFAVLRIAESKNEAIVGSDTFSLASGHPGEREAFERLRGKLDMLDQHELSGRLEALRGEGRVWVAPSLGAERWAVFVASLRLVRRVYIRGPALLDPGAHLYAQGRREGSAAQQEAFGWLSLGGALRHELAHYDGELDESAAYARELGWYAEVRRSAFVEGLDPATRRAWDWALDSAELSARAARDTATR